MENAAILIILVFVLIFALNGARKRLKGGCCGSGSSKPKKVKSSDTNTANYSYKITAHIDGMTCEHCKIRMENAFNTLPGCFAKVSLRENCAEIWSKNALSEAEISEIVKKNGYHLTRVENK